MLPTRTQTPNSTAERSTIVFLFILESLGSTELLFILVMALVFFGPRKLPQISKSLGKSLAEFRRASDDFKRTWEREVAIESTKTDSLSSFDPQATTDPVNTILEPRVEPLPAEHSIARDLEIETPQVAAETEPTNQNPSEPLRKRDWL